MESDVSALAVVYVVLHVLLSFLAPCVWWVVELQNEVVGGYLALGDMLGRAEHRELHVESFLVVLEPLESGCGESFVQSATFGEYQYATW